MPVEAAPLSLLAPHSAYEVERKSDLGATDAASSTAESGAVFEELLKNMALSTNQHINQAQAAGEAFASGQRDDIHGTMIALSKADIELRVIGNVKNKIIDAFYELWRMQI
jgi:flagellar hook-basal body complex protein FliE